MTASELLQLHLNNFGNPTSTDIYTDDLAIDFPYAPQHHTGRLEGKDAVISYLGKVGKFFRDFRIDAPVLTLTDNPDFLIAEYPGHAVSNETNLEYHQNYVAFVTIKDGKIAHIREYYNPIKVLVAGGEIEEPGEE